MNIQRLKPLLIALCSLSIIPLLGTIYVHLNHAGGTSHSLVTDLDRQLPFLKVFILPYMGWYAFLILAFIYLAVKQREVYYETLLQFIFGLLTCYAIYALYQTYVPRPELVGNDFLTKAVRLVYSTDEPLNCFPSTHVLTSYLMMKAYLRSSSVAKPVRILVTVMSLLIIASTQFVKQHVLLDIAGAIAVAETAIYAIRRLRQYAYGNNYSLSMLKLEVDLPQSTQALKRGA
ncbi:phosphatase PAP2 family protein [Paenibacillus aestuarii]|uniref:Phosphatase PAP2 family protein n=1 Tax=Paenibacillus aestuarii TaxID=516965 RepID=A0ABW0KGR2_9BACL|nr:phosphatase PAP2 family protein [Paenibacillus aestuarii]